MSAVTVYQSRLKAIRARTASQVAALFTAAPDLSPAAAEAFARRAATTVAAGQMLAAGTTNAYIARAARIRPVRITPGQVTGAAARRGLDPLEEYLRPFTVARVALDSGEPFELAVARGRDRSMLLAVTDVWLATRATTEVIDRVTAKITGWVRVADVGACDLCSAADGLPMKEAADLAGHPGCGCTSEPTFSDSPPSEAVDPEVVDVHEHDELGPVLYQAGQHFSR